MELPFLVGLKFAVINSVGFEIYVLIRSQNITFKIDSYELVSDKNCISNYLW